MAKVTSKVEEIDGVKYIVERREDGTIICRSIYAEPFVEKSAEVDVENLSEVDFRKLMLEKQGYRIRKAKT